MRNKGRWLGSLVFPSLGWMCNTLSHCYLRQKRAGEQNQASLSHISCMLLQTIKAHLPWLLAPLLWTPFWWISSSSESSLNWTFFLASFSSPKKIKDFVIFFHEFQFLCQKSLNYIFIHFIGQIMFQNFCVKIQLYFFLKYFLWNASFFCKVTQP